MIAEEKEKEFERHISFLDYHASFSNYEGVKKAKEFRNSGKKESIKESEDFINSVKNNEFKNNPLIEAVKKLRELNLEKSKDDNIFNSINLNNLIKEDL